MCDSQLVGFNPGLYTHVAYIGSTETVYERIYWVGWSSAVFEMPFLISYWGRKSK